jgi:hypothetical protein
MIMAQIIVILDDESVCLMRLSWIDTTAYWQMSNHPGLLLNLLVLCSIYGWNVISEIRLRAE